MTLKNLEINKSKFDLLYGKITYIGQVLGKQEIIIDINKLNIKKNINHTLKNS